MDLQHANIGGRWVARERGAFDRDDGFRRDVPPGDRSIARNARFSQEALEMLASICGMTVDQLLQRYV